MSPSACKKTTEVISVVCSLSLSEMAPDVKALEEQIIETVNQAGREFYGKVFAAFRERWIVQRRSRYRCQRWRTINQVTPFGLIRLPVRVVRSREDGRYVTLSKLLAFGGEARLGSRHFFQLSAGDGRVVAVAARACKRVADLALRAVSRSETVRATGATMVAGSGRAKECRRSSHRDGFDLPQTSATRSHCRRAGEPFSHAFGDALQWTRAPLP
jgi:hypothetical protein